MAKNTEQSELGWDRLLKIKTTGRDDSRSDQYRYPYEPTPYSVLERLAGSGYVGKKHHLLDYGCGKGRVGLYLSYQLRCSSIGVDYDERMYQAACRNKESAISGAKAEFVLSDARIYQIPTDIDRIYFFNPFSVDIMKIVMQRILESYDENPRELLLMFYYPSDEYVSFLMTEPSLMFVDEIDCGDLFEGNDPREKILIFEIS